jgi:hypothetical protein
VPFHRIPGKLKEHYGIDAPASTAQGIAEEHARQIHQQQQSVINEIPACKGKEFLIAEMDGSMVPVVETTEAEDRRKTRTVKWQEARLCMVREPGTVEGRFDGAMGAADEAGLRLLTAAVREGMGRATRMHCVGDGAPWIAEQVDLVFGAQGSYLIDFYHLCEYVQKAAEMIAPEDKTAWTALQKQRLKEGLLHEVMQELRDHLPSEECPEQDEPVRALYRYLHNRPGQFQYPQAIARGLPIGSGEIESGHRHVIQHRLKLSGAWWRPDTADHMIALRVCRANNEWDAYWQKAA